ncbi:HAD-IC family P-type ATPase [Neobittarella massiliensis]|uniref:HAD-IC family P-type ATPase n=1 Tax=Neobittarella massiliensis (ex Bilen et al. 2018) TaxID=2041842 RepID=A0A8J6IP34_9FIRM|nr:HAD-IC family P-type ATPase [Neobittarella massiliensis]MBC3515893.1 HAD-IC family P-type ATPase [Neobittarella massiliensis]
MPSSRADTDLLAREGLSEESAAERARQGLLNKDATPPTKSIGRIVLDNTFTLFNLVILVLGGAILAVGSYKNALFMGIMVVNTLVGIVQEVRTKRVMDRLSILSAARVQVVRGGAVKPVGREQVVLGDVMELCRGDQIVADCQLLTGACEVSEAMLTGESDPVHKKPGDTLLSGSFLVSGGGRALVTEVGQAGYAARISGHQTRTERPQSQIYGSVRRIIKAVSVAIVPVGALFLYSQLSIDGATVQQAIVSTAAALVGMIPEGLVLLTTSVLAVGVIRLARHRVMVQELVCIEQLARVDVLCLDKTGTITQGQMKLEELVCADGQDSDRAAKMLADFCGVMAGDSPTLDAIAAVHCNRQLAADPVAVVPFSSERKYSAVQFDSWGSLVLGAPEIVLPGALDTAFGGRLADRPRHSRTLLLCQSAQPLTGDALPAALRPVAAVLVQDVVRPEAADTLRYFAEQGVALKVISGDDAQTVAAIAQRVQLPGAERYVDATTLQSDGDIAAAVQQYTVFGRVSPEQKQKMVAALQQQGHTVAMTGDGVNDVLALRQADCSVAMASGAQAARNVSHLVLLDNDFSSMPRVVAEGRRSINNLQRSAAIFIVKTIYSILLVALFLLLHRPYPFAPIHLTLISALAIGIPSFVLALEPNHERVQGDFLKNVLYRALPGGFSTVLMVVATALLGPLLGFTAAQVSTLCVFFTAVVGFSLIAVLCLPFDWLRAALLIFIVAAFLAGSLLLGPLFSMSALTLPISVAALVGGLLAAGLFAGLSHLVEKFLHV